MARVSAAEKGRRYLTEGRVTLLQVRGRDVAAIVRGSGAFYSVTHTAGAWSCDCEARGRCSHIEAVMLVTAPVRPKRPSS